jgi:hypothetical protein
MMDILGVVLVCKNCMMTTLNINKENAQDMVQLILKKIQYGNIIVEMYDDTDV